MYKPLLLVIASVLATSGCAPVDDKPPSTRAGWSLAGKPLLSCSPSTELPPALKAGKAPIYPVKRAMLKEDGYAVFEFDVTPEGRATRFKSIDYSHPSFYAHAKAAVVEWTFEPALDEQVPVTVRCRYRQNFRISGDRRRKP